MFATTMILKDIIRDISIESSQSVHGLLISFNFQKKIILLNEVAGTNENFCDLAVERRADGGLHLHGLDRGEDVPDLHTLTQLDRQSDNHAWHRRDDLFRIALIALAALRRGRRNGPVRHLDDTRLAVQLEEGGHLALLVGFPDCRQADMLRVTNGLGRGVQSAVISTTLAVRSSTTSYGRIRSWRPRLPPLTYTCSYSKADESTTTSDRPLWPNGLMPPTL